MDLIASFELRIFIACISFCLSLAGGELFDRIAADDYKMTEAEVINYMRQVCDGLKHMHEHSIVHLDVKVFWFSYLASRDKYLWGANAIVLASTSACVHEQKF